MIDQTAAMDMVGKQGTAKADIEAFGADGIANVDNRAWSAFAGRNQSIKHSAA